MHNNFTGKGLTSLVHALIKRAPLQTLRLTGVKFGNSVSNININMTSSYEFFYSNCCGLRNFYYYYNRLLVFNNNNILQARKQTLNMERKINYQL